MTISKEERAELRDDLARDCYPNDAYTPLLDALDASDERIASLEAEVAECHAALNERSVAAVEAGMDRLIASEIGKNEAQIASLQKRIAELEAAAHYDAWLLSGDTGMSSKAIFDFMRTGAKGGWTPSDPSDLGRCLRLLERFPEWRARMPEMADCSPKWAAIIPHWDLLEATLLSEVGGLRSRGNAPKTFGMMLAIERGEDPTTEPVAPALKPLTFFPRCPR